jgi:hypothetical protein
MCIKCKSNDKYEQLLHKCFTLHQNNLTEVGFYILYIISGFHNGLNKKMTPCSEITMAVILLLIMAGNYKL